MRKQGLDKRSRSGEQKLSKGHGESKSSLAIWYFDTRTLNITQLTCRKQAYLLNKYIIIA
jgi:hypothetical protein